MPPTEAYHSLWEQSAWHRESSLFDKIDDDIFIIFIDGLDEKFWYDFEQRRWVYYLDLIMIELIYI